MPLPTIEEFGGGVKVTIKRKTIDEIIAERDGNVGNVSVTNVGNNVGNVSVIKLSKRQQVIVDTIKSNPFVTAKEMSVTMSVTKRTIERNLSALQKANIIRHEGRTNDGIWVVLESQKGNE